MVRIAKAPTEDGDARQSIVTTQKHVRKLPKAYGLGLLFVCTNMVATKDNASA